MTLKTVNQFFNRTHHLLIIHQNAIFGKKILSGSGDTEWTRLDTRRKYYPDKYSATFWAFAVTLTLSAVIPQDTPVCDAVLSNQVWLQTDQQFRRYNRNSQILIIRHRNWRKCLGSTEPQWLGSRGRLGPGGVQKQCPAERSRGGEAPSAQNEFGYLETSSLPLSAQKLWKTFLCVCALKHQNQQFITFSIPLTNF